MTVAEEIGTVRIALAGSGTAKIDWGDGATDRIALGVKPDTVVRRYADSSGVRRIRIEGAVSVPDCSKCGLTALDVRGNSGLRELDCSFNGLTGLDASKNTVLKRLNCAGNQLGLVN
jgi:hypothetical protein